MEVPGAPVKVYIAGPMAGIPQFNYPLFNLVDELLQRSGFETVNPARMDEYQDTAIAHSGDPATGLGVDPKSRAAFLKRDFYYLSQCDGIVMLPGWQGSTGANCELWVAHMMGLEVFVMEETEDEILLTEAPSLIPLFGPMFKHVKHQAGLA